MPCRWAGVTGSLRDALAQNLAARQLGARLHLGLLTLQKLSRIVVVVHCVPQ